MKGKIILILAVLSLWFTGFLSGILYKNYSKKDRSVEVKPVKLLIPENGVVKDDSTAAKIAEAIALPFYGTEILMQKPFNVRLDYDSIWRIRGRNYHNNPNHKGGVLIIDLLKKDGRAIVVRHSK